jgi:hypothetical protein
MDRRWFLLDINQVNGPFSVPEIEGMLQSVANPLIWGRGLSEWISPMLWREALKDPNFSNPVTAQEPRWKYRSGDREFGPVSYSELIQALKKELDYTGITVWNETTNEWAEIYLVPKVSDELGVSRRVHPRVPIMGTLQCDLPQGSTSVKVISISEGGVGVSSAANFKIGDKFKATLASPNLFISINCIIEVMYVGTEGYCGLRFVNLPMEAKSAVIEYVNKFKELEK